MIAQTRKLETALPEGLTKQLKAALLILEAVDEADSDALEFDSACDLQVAIDRIKYVLGEAKPQPIGHTPEERAEVLRKLELLELAEAA